MGRQSAKTIFIVLVFILLTGCGQQTVGYVTQMDNYISTHFLSQQYQYAKNHDVPLNYCQDSKKLNSWLSKLEDNPIATINVEKDNLLGAIRYKSTSQASEFTYIGELLDNRPDGYGILMQHESSFLTIQYDRLVYVGEFKDGRYHGYGIQFNLPTSEDIQNTSYYLRIANEADLLPYYNAWLNCAEYDGEFSKGVRQGVGNQYQIELVAQLMYQLDVLHQETFDPTSMHVFITTGNFSKDMLNGDVSIYGVDGYLEYQGSMKNGEKSGKGSLYYSGSTNLKYIGNFKHDEYDGQGTLYDESGNEIYSGKWKAGDYA